MAGKSTFNLPFAEAEVFFKDKLGIPSERWDDLWQAEHAKGFMVAGAMQADLLADFRGAVEKAVAGGMTLPEFREQFDDIVQKHGWAYNGSRNWRSAIIYDTNVTTAYQAGRWQQFVEGGATHLMYVHADGVLNPRPEHQAMHGTVRPIGDDFWHSWYPPNGWGCHCRAVRAEAGEQTELPPGWDVIDQKTGAPVGIGKGWDYNVGQAGMDSHHAILGEKLASLPAPWRKTLYGKLASRLDPLCDRYFHEWGLAVAQDVTQAGRIKTNREMITVMHIAPETIDALPLTPETTAVAISDKEWLHLQHAEQPGGAKRKPEHVLSREDALQLPALMRNALPWWDTKDGRLLYVFDGAEKAGKVAVAINYRVRGGMFNSVRTALFVEPGDIVQGERYRRLPAGE
ncbi:phage minor head protein [Desulfuromonas thiophila]|uniref:phage head morphogenesis protein n=1 Tax=Desulfuromonas thiophila TaxID=57664 RepID=UPI0029F51DA1|nr:phage minor head protein [Desulfuromonas thiophila]